ncbi:MAG TPA: AAA family ATPase [Nitrospiraceae bacterium]|jgi:predicted ATPase|nr:AAA family ATPase [Nitrospiraceae bacterium]
MNLGLCGSHRTGKTTLAEAISQRMGIPFVKTGTSEVFRQHGLDPSNPLDFEKRLWIQHKILNAAERVWQSEEKPFVTDRTPLDMAAYTLADIRGSTEVNFAELEGYLSRCFDVTNKIFKLLVLVQPGIPLVYEEGKAALNESYLEHLNFLILGLCNDARIKSIFLYIDRHTTDIENRVRTILEAIEKVKADIKTN